MFRLGSSWPDGCRELMGSPVKWICFSIRITQHFCLGLLKLVDPDI